VRQTEKDIRRRGEKRCRGSKKRKNNKRLRREKKDHCGQRGIAEKEGKADESTLGAWMP